MINKYGSNNLNIPSDTSNNNEGVFLDFKHDPKKPKESVEAWNDNMPTINDENRFDRIGKYLIDNQKPIFIGVFIITMILLIVFIVLFATKNCDDERKKYLTKFNNLNEKLSEIKDKLKEKQTDHETKIKNIKQSHKDKIKSVLKSMGYDITDEDVSIDTIVDEFNTKISESTKLLKNNIQTHNQEIISALEALNYTIDDETKLSINTILDATDMQIDKIKSNLKNTIIDKLGVDNSDTALLTIDTIVDNYNNEKNAIINSLNNEKDTYTSLIEESIVKLGGEINEESYINIIKLIDEYIVTISNLNMIINDYNKTYNNLLVARNQLQIEKNALDSINDEQLAEYTSNLDRLTKQLEEYEKKYETCGKDSGGYTVHSYAKLINYKRNMLSNNKTFFNKRGGYIKEMLLDNPQMEESIFRHLEIKTLLNILFIKIIDIERIDNEEYKNNIALFEKYSTILSELEYHILYNTHKYMFDKQLENRYILDSSNSSYLSYFKDFIYLNRALQLTQMFVPDHDLDDYLSIYNGNKKYHFDRYFFVGWNHNQNGYNDNIPYINDLFSKKEEEELTKDFYNYELYQLYYYTEIQLFKLMRQNDFHPKMDIYSYINHQASSETLLFYVLKRRGGYSTYDLFPIIVLKSELDEYQDYDLYPRAIKKTTHSIQTLHTLEPEFNFHINMDNQYINKNIDKFLKQYV